MKTSSYEECEESDVNDPSETNDETRVSEVGNVNEIETDENVIFKKVNPVYFSESNVASRKSSVADTSWEQSDSYINRARLDSTQENIEAPEMTAMSSQPYLQTLTESEFETNVAQERNNIDLFRSIFKSPEENVTQNEYRNIEIVSPEEVQKVESNNEKWSDSTSQISFPGQAEDIETIPSDTEPVLAQCEQVSEYYTASSEVSLLSDVDPPEKTQREDLEKEGKDDQKEGVIAGHVAAMREKFESMTRTNTPCPDLIRSLSPSLEVFRNISPSPDRLT